MNVKCGKLIFLDTFKEKKWLTLPNIYITGIYSAGSLPLSHIPITSPFKKETRTFHCKSVCCRNSVSLYSLGFLSINSNLEEYWKEGTSNGLIPGKVFILAFPRPRKVSMLEKAPHHAPGCMAKTINRKKEAIPPCSSLCL